MALDQIHSMSLPTYLEATTRALSMLTFASAAHTELHAGADPIEYAFVNDSRCEQQSSV